MQAGFEGGYRFPGTRSTLGVPALLCKQFSRPHLSEGLLLLRLTRGVLKVFHNPPNGVHLLYDEFMYFLQNLEN